MKCGDLKVISVMGGYRIVECVGRSKDEREYYTIELPELYSSEQSAIETMNLIKEGKKIV